MFCKECKVNVDYQTDICPLCGAKISDKILKNNIFPKRDASFRFPLKYSFTRYYLLLTASIFLIVLLINLLTSSEIMWAFIVGGGLLYIYALIKYAILSPVGSPFKLLIHVITLSLLLWLIQYSISPNQHWAYNYVIPLVLFANTLVMWTFTLIHHIRRASYAVNLIIMSVLNIIPLFFYNFGLSKVLWPVLLTSVFSIITLFVVYNVFGKLLLSEIKKLFHC